MPFHDFDLVEAHDISLERINVDINKDFCMDYLICDGTAQGKGLPMLSIAYKRED